MNKNILVLSYSDVRGDGIAAFNLTKCLLKAGYNAALMVINKGRTESFVIPIYNFEERSLFNRIVKKVKNKFLSKPDGLTEIDVNKKYDFFVNQEIKPLVPVELIIKSIPFVPDLILVGAMHDFINTSSLGQLKRRTGAEVYMLMTDMFPLTGGCQHAWDCIGYQSDCSNCPAIIGKGYEDVAKINLAVKLKNVKKFGLNILAGSGRTLVQAQQSTLFANKKNIYNINSFIDVDIFNDRSRSVAKAIFNIPFETKVIFTAAEYTNNERKGIKYFVEALNLLWDQLAVGSRNNIAILIAGKMESLNNNDIIKSIPFDKVLIDFITDDRLLALAYQASDVFVCSSVEDPGPMTVSQALACGTPVVGFEMGLLYNMVENNFNGYKAELRNSKDLAFGIGHVLSLSQEDYEKYSKNAVFQVRECSSGEAFLKVINKILH